MPERIQRKRTPGWRMPPGAVSVTRPGKWGNPWRVIRGDHDKWMVYPTGSEWTTVSIHDTHHAAVQTAVDQFRRAATHPEVIAAARRELAGRDLACWCPLDMPCHGDVLLEIANEPIERSAIGALIQPGTYLLKGHANWASDVP